MRIPSELHSIFLLFSMGKFALKQGRVSDKENGQTKEISCVRPAYFHQGLRGRNAAERRFHEERCQPCSIKTRKGTVMLANFKLFLTGHGVLSFKRTICWRNLCVFLLVGILVTPPFASLADTLNTLPCGMELRHLAAGVGRVPDLP